MSLESDCRGEGFPIRRCCHQDESVGGRRQCCCGTQADESAARYSVEKRAKAAAALDPQRVAEDPSGPLSVNEVGFAPGVAGLHGCC